MKRVLFLCPLILGLALALGACSGNQPPAAATSAPAIASTVQATPAPAAATPAPAAASTATRPAPAAAAGAGVGTPEAETPAPTKAITADLPALKPGALKSYVAHIEFREEGVGAAAAQATPQAPGNVELRYNSEPAPGLYSWNMTGGSSPADPTQNFKMIQAGQDTYIFMSDQSKWLQMPAGNTQQMPVLQDVLDPNKLAQDAPAGLLSKDNVVNAHESVDGVDTTHYKATEAQAKELNQATGDPNVTSTGGSADFWVANDNGYLKQYVLTVNLKDQAGKEYRQTIKMTLTDENKPVAIATPAPDQIVSMDAFQQGMATAAVQGGTATRTAMNDLLKTLPTPPQGKSIAAGDMPEAIGALARNTLPDINQAALYQSTADRETLRKFYQDQLTAQGWQQSEDNPSTDPMMPDQTSYGKGSATLSVFILQDPTGKQNYVLVTVEG